MHGTVRHIHIAPEQGAPPEAVTAVDAVADAGLRGDRYFQAEGTFAERDGSDLTLIEAEALEAVAAAFDLEIEPGSHRRNVTTTGISLESLLGTTFTMGDVRCRAVDRCAPCAYLERHLDQPGLVDALDGRGGLRCRVLEGGTITVGDEVRPVQTEQ